MDLSINTLGSGVQSPTVSVVIPALNEERNLPHVFAALPAGITEVILVDGGSVDRTVAVARELRPDVVVVHQSVSRAHDTASHPRSRAIAGHLDSA